MSRVCVCGGGRKGGHKFVRRAGANWRIATLNNAKRARALQLFHGEFILEPLGCVHELLRLLRAAPPTCGKEAAWHGENCEYEIIEKFTGKENMGKFMDK